MKLKEKTRRKFVEFFDKMSQMHHGKEFELAYSDIQRETGAASVTLRRAVQALQEEGIIGINPGHNSRYAKFLYLPTQEEGIEENTADEIATLNQAAEHNEISFSAEEINDLLNLVDHLRRRVRSQEMAISLLQDRLADIEEKINKR